MAPPPPPPPSPPLMVKLRTIETCGVSPPEGSVPPSTVPLTFFDVFFLHARPMERLFFYPFPHPTSHFLSSFLPSLKSSLSLSLRSFFPLASLLRPSPGASSASDRFELFYSDATSPGVLFTVAECVDDGSSGGLFDRLSGPRPRDVTVFPHHGVVVGTTMHHAACDGSSYTLFRQTWAAAARRSSGDISLYAHPLGPVVDRSLVPDPHGLYSLFYKTVAGKSPIPAPASSPADVVLASFTIKSSHIKALKAAFRCSTAAVTFAFTWINYVRARELAKRNDKVYLAIPVDFRSRMRPPLPAEYFGNCIGPCYVEAEAADLSGANGLTAAAEAIDRAIKSVASAGFEGAEPEKWLETIRGLPAEAILTGAGSHRFGVYDTDFGWGRPAHVDLTSVARTGVVAVAESGEEEGGLRTIETCGVSPPEGSVPPTAVPLTFFDLMFLHACPMERLFFYPFPHPTSHFLSSFLPSLKSSLSLSLRSFFPLASLLRPSPGASDRFELFYSDATSPGVLFTVAECVDDGSSGGLFDRLAGPRPRDVGQLRALVPRLAPPDSAGSQPLLAVQVTVFPHHGVVVGTTMHHATCDGSSYTLFRQTWAAAARRSSGDISLDAHPIGPVVDRSLVLDSHGLYSLFYKTVSGKSPFPAAASYPTDVVLASFTIKRSHIKALKAAFRCSTAAVTFAFTWISYVRARELAKGNDRVYFGIPVDFRSRMRPPLPAEYFGNCIGPCHAEAEAADLSGANGLTLAAEAIDRAIKSVASAGFEGAEPEKWLEMMWGRPAEAVLIAAGSHRFGVYDTDFGWGRPAHVDLTSVARTGVVAVAESGEEEGGVEIGLALPRNQMDLFQIYFAEGLGRLDAKAKKRLVSTESIYSVTWYMGPKPVQ
ncbi:Anthocyanin 5-aromatic acyltransferase [Ananas comosus]|uniref:Anthocyanin 5-aromatic acyltransferase n=1 Tax=Ananas comosus TaxID=4615 RepID=A0A199W4H2_ANACO|nr:Anthocyanin 5-aromatic acyltransferase [Ananas comosus]